MTDSQIDQLIAAARELPTGVRLRVAQRVIEGLPAEDQLRVVRDAASANAATSGKRAPAMLGLFADEPELIDEVCRHVYSARSAIRQLP